MNLKGIFVIAGPTGSGKSNLAVALARELGAEIVSADAFQVYRGLGVLTAQPSPEELRAVPHQLVGTLPPEADFSAADFARLGGSAINDIQKRGRLALVVGGAGFYLNALFGRTIPAPPPAPALRKELASLPLAELLANLEAADPEAALKVDRQNPRRVQRALEIVLTTGRPFAAFAPSPVEMPPGVVLQPEREELHRRIDQRAKVMLEQGALEEVAALGEISATCAQIIGLRSIQRYQRSEMSLEDCLLEIMLATRQYAKRQQTWFRGKAPWAPVAPESAQETIRRLLA